MIEVDGVPVQAAADGIFGRDSASTTSSTAASVRDAILACPLDRGAVHTSLQPRQVGTRRREPDRRGGRALETRQAEPPRLASAGFTIATAAPRSALFRRIVGRGPWGGLAKPRADGRTPSPEWAKTQAPNATARIVSHPRPASGPTSTAFRRPEHHHWLRMEFSGGTAASLLRLIRRSPRASRTPVLDARRSRSHVPRAPLRLGRCRRGPRVAAVAEK